MESVNLPAVETAIAAACAAASRQRDSVTLVAVSKRMPLSKVLAAAALGQKDFGENYAQELRDKAHSPGTEGLRWHFIGALQKNKVRLVVGTAALIHTVDDRELLQAIADRARSKGLVQDCLIEVNVDDEGQKAGCGMDQVKDLLDAFAEQGGAVRCLGLMCIPKALPEGASPEESRPAFRRLRELAKAQAQIQRPYVDLRHLSMGMSHDYPVAISEGATLIRIGTAIFGNRPA